MAAVFADWRTTHQTTFSLMPEPQTVPLCVTQRKMCPLNASHRQPFIHRKLHPAGHRHRAHMATLAEEINDSPVIVALLKVRQLQPDQLGTSQTAAEQERQDGMISFALRDVPVGGVKEPAPLNTCEPVTDPGTELLRALYPPDTRCEVRASRPLSAAS